MQNTLAEPPPLCADCGADDPAWASLNRGILICTDCCYVHRNLGRYISQIRSLKKGHWEAPQLELIKLLHRSGSNRIWEHALTQPQYINSVKKPVASDPVFPTKEAFIKAKYVEQQFTIKQSKDDEPWNIEDLNRQLWSCVRAPHVDTTLRLLVLGADPNYADAEKQNTPLHVAAKEGQALQVELLFIYGASPTLKNAAGNTPSQVARLENNNELAHRLEELCFEMTNRLSLFLCGRKPDHAKGQHFLVPDLVGKDNVELRTVKNALQCLPHGQFQKIAQDVYDEVDRRETVAAWEALREKAAKHLANEQCVAVFLPLNASIPAMRNQQRQKLAKYSSRQLASLIIDILKESKRRFLGQEAPVEEMDNGEPTFLGIKKMNSSINDMSARYLSGSRDYDDVADLRSRISAGTRGSSARVQRCSAGSVHSEGYEREARIPMDDVLELKERMRECESSIQLLLNTNSILNKKLTGMHVTLDRYYSDNVMLREEVSRLADLIQHITLSRRMPSPALPNTIMSVSTASVNNNGERKMSRPNVLDSAVDARKRNQIPLASPGGQSRTLPPSGRASVDHMRERSDEFERIDHPMENVASPRIDEVFNAAGFPDNLIRETECLTTAIRQLLADAQRGILTSVAEKHAYNIGSLIRHIIDLIPFDRRTQSIDETVAVLAEATAILSAKCNSPQLDSEETCHAAYKVAKAAKSLLMAVHD